MLFLVLLFITPVWAQEALPIAPKRYDVRDELPSAAFVSLTGQDPIPKLDPTQEKSPKMLANKKNKSAPRMPASTKVKRKPSKKILKKRPHKVGK